MGLKQRREIAELYRKNAGLRHLNSYLEHDAKETRRLNKRIFDRKKALDAALEHGPSTTAVERAKAYYAFVTGADA